MPPVGWNVMKKDGAKGQAVESKQAFKIIKNFKMATKDEEEADEDTSSVAAPPSTAPWCCVKQLT